MDLNRLSVPSFLHPAPCTLVVLQDGQVTVDEFEKALQDACLGKSFPDLPWAFRQFIQAMFHTIDMDGGFGCPGTGGWCQERENFGKAVSIVGIDLYYPINAEKILLYLYINFIFYETNVTRSQHP